MCDQYNAIFIINDDIELALEVDADGVHIGIHDSPLQQARKKIGTEKIIGVSCYNKLELAEQAVAEGANYIAFGSFFSSQIKPEAARATPDLLLTAKQQFDIQVYEHTNNYWLGDMNRVHIFLNDGQGGFNVAPETPIELSPYDNGGILAIADFTGDGLVDVAIGSGSSVAIYGKDRFLGYTLSATLSTGNDQWYPAAGVTADFNEDGRPDLAVTTGGYYLANPGTVVYLSTPTGLGPATQLQYEYLNGGSIAAGDFTGDGHADLAILHDYYRNSYGIQDGNVISLLPGNGHGDFTELPHQLLNRRALGLVGASDMNGDGKLDLVLTAAPWPSNYVGGFPGLDYSSSWILLGEGQGNFHPATPDPVPMVPLSSEGASFVTLADLNRDGFQDVVMGSSTAPTVRFLLNDKNGRLQSAPESLHTGILFSQSDAGARRLVDVNSDGLTDLLVLFGRKPKTVGCLPEIARQSTELAWDHFRRRS